MREKRFVDFEVVGAYLTEIHPTEVLSLVVERDRDGRWRASNTASFAI